MKTMQMRVFLRGGYKEITELTIITNHGNPVATWLPQTHAKKRESSLSSKATMGVSSTVLTKHSPEHGE